MADDQDSIESERNEKPASDAGTDSVIMIEAPPTKIGGILRRLGPGLIIAGSIVGSGELIATTTTGAKAGFWLLWLILIGCVIKVFVQVEMGRYTLVTGRTTMDGLAEVPGPHIKGHGNWLIWFWALVFLATIGQVGGIVGGVGQALQISVPITESGRQFNAQVDVETQYTVSVGELGLAEKRAIAGDAAGQARAAELKPIIEQLAKTFVAERLAVADQQVADLRTRASQNEAAAKQLVVTNKAYVIVKNRLAVTARPEELFSKQGDDLSDAEDALKDAVATLGRRSSRDDEIWALITAIVTAAILVVGRYGFIQSFSTAMVVSFTFITIVNLFMLQNNAYWAVGVGDILDGMSFRLPPSSAAAVGATGIATALATFGIIGVGANELISYPYWCLEKGYARFTGPRNDTDQWAVRARGWMRVMRWDAWCSMVIYTFATLAFYLLGAAILSRTGLIPAADEMIRTLGVMYEPVFGSIARWIFLFGAFAVLYSTFFVATASLARVVPDGMRVIGIGPKTEASYQNWVRGFSALFPFLCVLAYSIFQQPVELVLIGGVMQGVMLPMLAGAALYFRYKRNDSRITPKFLWDAFLWLSAIGMLITGVWGAWTACGKLLPHLTALVGM
ncbi:MAG TPA: Nramp family divalent metal transporter [Pirellulaceae bacterium]|nr:Nramp family divalent metal transporter [Pirellulaceae bacterium]